MTENRFNQVNRRLRRNLGCGKINFKSCLKLKTCFKWDKPPIALCGRFASTAGNRCSPTEQNPPPDPLPRRRTDLTTTRQTARHAGLCYVLWTNPKEACTRPPMSTWRPPRVPSNKLELIRGRTWPPYFPMVRDWRLGIASPSSRVSETVRYPLNFPTEPGQYEWGLGKP